MPSINLLVKPASGLCNMKCEYCFYCDEVQKREQALYGLMSLDTLKNVIRRTLLPAEGQYTIMFQGGEPTLCGLDFFREAVALTEQYNQNHIPVHFALQTNGYSITEEWARFFAENHFLLGISIDGTKEIHNRYRHAAGGGDTYDRILQTTKLLDRFHVDYNILTVLHRDTAEHIEEIYHEYKRNGWRFLQFICCLDPLGEPRGEKEYSLTPEMYGNCLISLFQCWKKDFEKEQEPWIRMFENHVRILSGYRPESCEQCGSCGIQYVVEADGSVFPCDFYALDEYYLGNLNQNRIAEIDRKRKEIGFLERSMQIPNKCQNCTWHRLCRNGCYRSRMTETGDNLSYYCAGFQAFFDACGEDLKRIALTIRQRKQKKNIIC